ncbi:MAG TPA: ABC transporter substrate-binding protein [Actinomycetota bacterium]|nr:ABC transporter substrate-binding protein [Actinomycetota bacterium]
MTSIRMGVFYQSLPMMAAQALRSYEAEGLEVDYQRVTSSIQQFESLRDDRYDIVQTSPDNVANYRLNEGNPLGDRVPSVGFMGMDDGMNLTLVVGPEIEEPAQLKGRTVSVDAPFSGFAYVLYKILRRAGLERDVDYDVVPTGGVADRYTALLAGEFDGTLLSGGFETRAVGQGYRIVGSVYDIASPYLGVMACAKDQWLEAHGDEVIRFIRASHAATRWCFDPSNRDEAIDMLAGLPNTDRALAAQLYEVQLREGVGVIRDLGIDGAGIRNVLELRREFDGFETDPDLDALAAPGGGLYDLRFLEQALGGYR